LIFATLPVIWLIKWRKRRKTKPAGKCNACSYDLTGNKTGMCPECGATFDKPIEAQA
jgi:predicted amidophosphoribosyltransferase